MKPRLRILYTIMDRATGDLVAWSYSKQVAEDYFSKCMNPNKELKATFHSQLENTICMKYGNTEWIHKNVESIIEGKEILLTTDAKRILREEIDTK